MIDLETMSSRSDAAIIQLGAYHFDMNEPVGRYQGQEAFLENVFLESSIASGGHVSGVTMYWWLEQSEAARAALKSPQQKDLEYVLTKFGSWLLNHVAHGDSKEEICVWSHASFDTPILNAAYERVFGRKPPYSYRLNRDVRTLLHLAEEQGFDVKAAWPDRLGNDHIGSWDSWAQADVVQQCWQHLISDSENS